MALGIDEGTAEAGLGLAIAVVPGVPGPAPEEPVSPDSAASSDSGA
jgi:hypothetical protein